MRGGALPPAMLAASLCLALAYAPPKVRAPAAAIFCAAALALAFVPWPAGLIEYVFLASWAAVIAACASVHLSRGIDARLADALALIGGGLAGALVSLAGSPSDLAIALPCTLIVVPAAWLVASGRGIGVKIVSSWLIAIALLSAALPLTPTPGYEHDHME